ncbi:hypothetical protein ES708_35062 [subsurface metagenome]
MAHKGNLIVVGLTGQFGAGCTDVVAAYLKEVGFHYYSLSDVVKDSAQKRLGGFGYQELSKNKKELRRILQDEGNKLREAGSDVALNILSNAQALTPSYFSRTIPQLRNVFTDSYIGYGSR